MKNFALPVLFAFHLFGLSFPPAGNTEIKIASRQISEAQISISAETEKESHFYKDFMKVFEGYLFTLWREGAQTMANPGIWKINVTSDYLHNAGLPFVVISVYHEKFDTDLYLIPLFHTGTNQVASAAVNAALRTVAVIVQRTQKRKKEEETTF